MVEAVQIADAPNSRQKQAVAAPEDTTTVRSGRLYEDDMRLDAGYHTGTVVRARYLLAESGYPIQSLEGLTERVWYPTRFKRMYAASREHGTPFLTASMMSHLRPDSDAYLSNRPGQSEKCAVEPGWILITRSGSVGRCVLATERLSGFAVSDDAIRVQTIRVPAGYLYAYLSSWVGQALLTTDRYGAVIKHLEPRHIANVQVPVLHEMEMSDIASDIEEAYATRERANQLLDESLELVVQELRLPQLDKELPDTFLIKASDISNRLDASYHNPQALAAVYALRSGLYPTVGLSEACKNIFYPGRFKRRYVDEEHGVPFIQGSHIQLMQPYEQKYLARNDDRNLRQCRVHRRWVLITRSGTTGRIAVVSNAGDNGVASEHLIRLVPKEPEYNPGYIAAFLMTPYGQRQVQSKIYGAVVDELTSEDVAEVVIPNAPKELQDEIGDRVLQAFELKDQATAIERWAIGVLEAKLEGTENPQYIEAAGTFVVTPVEPAEDTEEPELTLGQWLVKYAPRGANLEVPDDEPPEDENPFADEDNE